MLGKVSDNFWSIFINDNDAINGDFTITEEMTITTDNYMAI